MHPADFGPTFDVPGLADHLNSLPPRRSLISMPLTGTLPNEWAAPGAFQALQILYINFNDIAGEV